MVTPYSVDQGVFNPGKPHLWADRPSRITNRAYALHPDGDRVVIEAAPQVVAPIKTVTIVTGFFDELRRLAPPQK